MVERNGEELALGVREQSPHSDGSAFHGSYLRFVVLRARPRENAARKCAGHVGTAPSRRLPITRASSRRPEPRFAREGLWGSGLPSHATTGPVLFSLRRSLSAVRLGQDSVHEERVDREAPQHLFPHQFTNRWGGGE